ncbi:hypothetical protein K1X22_06425 [Mycolicibacterium farcinogenes]|nr:hypothetical protein [Mycolicibacterium farcinogenes]QZH62984.1 hypothetical protein K1X22_06425 [Mycolicibacterium farcinogenes]
MQLSDSYVDDRYGGVGFLAAILNITLLEAVTWIFASWWMIALVVSPVLVLIDLAIAAIAAKGRGKIGQIGRGMKIGCIAAPLSLVIFIPIFLVAHAFGPV